MLESIPTLFDADEDAARVALDLARSAPTVEAATPVESVAERPFGEAIAVVDADRVVGLVTRALLAERLLARYGYALYGRRPIASLAMTDALRVPADTPLEFALLGALNRTADRAYDDLIVVDDDGRYLGLVSVERLVLHQMRALVRARAAERRAEERASALATHAELTSRFLATITHELRAPVNTMIGLSELVRAQLRAGRVDRADGHVATMRTTAAHLRGLVDDVLDQAKLDAKMSTVQLEAFDLATLLVDVAEATRPLVLGKPVEVVVDGADAPVPITSDRLKVRQILTNFASNAAKHTDAGAITLRLVRARARISIEVHDSGPGIDPERRDLLFRPFVQLDDPSTRRHGGTGLGLANAKRFAELLDASLEVTSAVPHGSVFTLHLEYR